MAKLLALSTVLVIPKGFRSPFTYVSTKELHCHCSRPQCHYTLISEQLIAKFNLLRQWVNNALYINSLFRCQMHNADPNTGGTDHSSHTTGNAIDISFRGLNNTQKRTLIAKAKEIFDYVKVYETFIHCQINK